MDEAEALALLRPWLCSPFELLRKAIGLDPRQSVHDHFQRDYGCIELCVNPDSEFHRWQPRLTSKLREVLDVLVALSCVPGLDVRENARFWSDVFQLLYGEQPHEDAVPIWVDDPTVFPRFRLSIDFYGVWPRPGDQQLRYCHEFLAWDRSTASLDYQEAMLRLLAVIPVRARANKSVLVELCFRTASFFRWQLRGDDELTPDALLGAFDALRSDNMAAYQHPSSLWSFVVDPVVKIDAIEVCRSKRDDLPKLTAMLTDHSVCWFPSLSIRWARGMSPNIHEVGAFITSVCGPATAVHEGRLRSLASEFGSDCHPQLASLWCSVLRVGHRPLQTLSLSFKNALKMDAMAWILFALVHRTSKLRIQELVVSAYMFANVDDAFINVLTGDRPGQALMDRTELAQLRQVEYPEWGTVALLSTNVFDLYRFVEPRKLFHRRKPSHVINVQFRGDPKFEVIAVAVDVIGILVHGFGFGSIERLRVIWGGTRSPAFFRAIGTLIKSLAIVADSTWPGFLLAQGVYDMLRCCPEVVALEIENACLGGLVSAYAEGNCKVKSLSCVFQTKNWAILVAPLISMLMNEDHPSHHILERIQLIQKDKEHISGDKVVAQLKRLLHYNRIRNIKYDDDTINAVQLVGNANTEQGNIKDVDVDSSVVETPSGVQQFAAENLNLREFLQRQTLPSNWTQLYLINVNLGQVPSTWSNMKLQDLDLSLNYLTTFPDDEDKVTEALKQLPTLNISGNALS
ncbi:TPA: hypothetical protein N0F65_009615 [Lagenidium giganteum]|uniref:Uncharacterized protein n=1 Tax=Lagenidium giganteum TaxID=4803 RepID=A0AAV2YWP3_9STRA|nr:TPA: hypothetical protein N0F65_009615 [Lagenidium giganteum]